MLCIKDMKMPDSCWECECAYLDFLCILTCSITGDVTPPVESDIRKLPNCPLIELGVKNE